MVETISIDFARPAPLFPLPNCVLLPHASIPLHIFEQRYRDMVHDALDSAGLIAMAMFQGDQWKSDYQGKPALRPHVCVGYIIKHEQLDDGRYNILLQGVCRARILREVEGRTYRTAILRPTEKRSTMEIDLSQHRQRLTELLNDPLLQQLSSVSALQNCLSEELPTAVLMDLAGMTVCDRMDDRYRLLAEADPFSRADWLAHLLGELRQTLSLAGKFEARRTSEGHCLN
ncbi:MAG: LON peptidase substrate-binding domain-containing protein [Phycisphaeraceae bacterium]